MATPQEIRHAASRFSAAYHVKGELTRDGAMVHGWCWSPARAGERLGVTLVMDGAEIGAAVASRLRLDLVRDGVCDGYHGFSFPLPARPFSCLEARETATGQAFGRILGDQMADVQTWAGQADVLAGLVNDADAACSLASPITPCPSPITPSHRRGPPRPVPDLPEFTSLAFSLVFDAERSTEGTLAAIIRLAPSLRAHAAEIVVVDHGCNPASAALASVAGLVYCRVTARNAAERLNQAVLAARGARILLASHQPPVGGFFTELPFGSLRVDSIETMLSKARESNEIVVSQQLLLAPADSVESGDAGGLLLSVDRDVFRVIGRFDPALDDGAHLPEIDFVLRAQKAGYHITARHDGTTAPAPDHRAAAASRLRFTQLRTGAMHV